MGKIRIIAGRWRGRKLNVPNEETLRPTPDRVRETLFNWLAENIHGATCLDLFAGTGALGFEALSRGAASCTFVEKHAQTAKTLQNNLVLIQACGDIQALDATQFLNSTSQAFDIIFLDPPFEKNLLQPICDLIVEKQLLKANGVLYVEKEKCSDDIALPWPCIKTKTAGEVAYSLYSNH